MGLINLLLSNYKQHFTCIYSNRHSWKFLGLSNNIPTKKLKILDFLSEKLLPIIMFP